MFQAEPILWLQAHASPALTWLLSAITLLGYAPTYVVAASWRWRSGSACVRASASLLALLVSGILTEGLKSGLALPRPIDVDPRAAPRWAIGARAHSPGLRASGATCAVARELLGRLAGLGLDRARRAGRAGSTSRRDAN